MTFKEGPVVTSIIEMAISYNYEYLAMFTDTGLLWIGSADLQVRSESWVFRKTNLDETLRQYVYIIDQARGQDG